MPSNHATPYFAQNPVLENPIFGVRPMELTYIQQFDPTTGEIIANYYTIGQCSRALGIDHGNLSRLLNGKLYKTLKGYGFRKVPREKGLKVVRPT